MRGGEFVQLVAALLTEMGFTDVYVRKGTENGRDIDARFGTELWFFECKYVEQIVDTPKAAYKLLQVDALSDSIRPDYFMFVTNGATASILRDIAGMKNADPSVSYHVDFWSEDEQRSFSDVLLSYPECYLKFCATNKISSSDRYAELVADFRSRSAQHIRERQRFLTRFRSAMAARKSNKIGNADFNRFALDHSLQIAHDVLWSFPLAVAVVAIPGAPLATLHNFRDAKTLQNLKDTMGHLGAAVIRVERDHIVLTEDTTWTVITNFGSIIMIDATIAVRGEIHLPEWIPYIREHSVRVRNFARLGILPLPFDVKAYVVGKKSQPTKLRFGGLSGMGRRRRLLSDVLGQIDDLLEGSEEEIATDELDANSRSPSMHFESAMVRIDTPPETHVNLARALSSSMWTLSGMAAPLDECAKSWLATLSKRTIRKRETAVSVETLEYFNSIWWLCHGELINRDFGVFQDFLRGRQDETQNIAAWQREAAEALKSLGG